MASKKSNDLHVNAMVAFSFGELPLRLSRGTSGVVVGDDGSVGEADRGASEVPNRVVQRGPVTNACKGQLSLDLLGISYLTLTLAHDVLIPDSDLHETTKPHSYIHRQVQAGTCDGFIKYTCT